eukprot:1158008-Pelagomonas_calceolata.AAC.9
MGKQAKGRLAWTDAVMNKVAMMSQKLWQKRDGLFAGRWKHTLTKGTWPYWPMQTQKKGTRSRHGCKAHGLLAHADTEERDTKQTRLKGTWLVGPRSHPALLTHAIQNKVRTLRCPYSCSYDSNSNNSKASAAVRALETLHQSRQVSWLSKRQQGISAYLPCFSSAHAFHGMPDHGGHAPIAHPRWHDFQPADGPEAGMMDIRIVSIQQGSDHGGHAPTPHPWRHDFQSANGPETGITCIRIASLLHRMWPWRACSVAHPQRLVLQPVGGPEAGMMRISVVFKATTGGT